VLYASLSRDRRERYARQLVLPELGPSGQAALAEARVLVVGAGGLGTPAIAYLAGVGLGALEIVDPGRVGRADLHRQILFGDADIGAPKAAVAAAHARDVDPDLEVVARDTAFTPDNGRRLVRDVDVVLDATDNPASRYLVSDACVLEDRPSVFGAVSRLEGQVAPLVGGGAPCYRCLHPEPPAPGSVPSCAETGIVGPAAGVIGSWMALEAIRWIVGGFGDDPPHGLMHLDLARWTVQRVRLDRRADCPICGDAPSIRDLVLEEAACLAGEPYPGPLASG
jgi:adenylyltransferase/sulfurtransferase